MIQENNKSPLDPYGRSPEQAARLQRLLEEIAFNEALAELSEWLSNSPLPEHCTEDQLMAEQVHRADDLFSFVAAKSRVTKLRKELRRISEPRVRIQTPPGSQLRKLSEFIFSRKVYETVLVPIFRDLLDEYCQALNEERLWKARWVRIRGYWSFWSAVFAQLPISAVKLVYKIWKATQ